DKPWQLAVPHGRIEQVASGDGRVHERVGKGAAVATRRDVKDHRGVSRRGHAVARRQQISPDDLHPHAVTARTCERLERSHIAEWSDEAPHTAEAATYQRFDDSRPDEAARARHQEQIAGTDDVQITFVHDEST